MRCVCRQVFEGEVRFGKEEVVGEFDHPYWAPNFDLKVAAEAYAETLYLRDGCTSILKDRDLGLVYRIDVANADLAPDNRMWTRFLVTVKVKLEFAARQEAIVPS